VLYISILKVLQNGGQGISFKLWVLLSFTLWCSKNNILNVFLMDFVHMIVM